MPEYDETVTSALPAVTIEKVLIERITKEKTGNSNNVLTIECTTEIPVVKVNNLDLNSRWLKDEDINENINISVFLADKEDEVVFLSDTKFAFNDEQAVLFNRAIEANAPQRVITPYLNGVEILKTLDTPEEILPVRRRHFTIVLDQEVGTEPIEFLTLFVCTQLDVDKLLEKAGVVAKGNDRLVFGTAQRIDVFSESEVVDDGTGRILYTTKIIQDEEKIELKSNMEEEVVVAQKASTVEAATPIKHPEFSDLFLARGINNKTIEGPARFLFAIDPLTIARGHTDLGLIFNKHIPELNDALIMASMKILRRRLKNDIVEVKKEEDALFDKDEAPKVIVMGVPKNRILNSKVPNGSVIMEHEGLSKEWGGLRVFTGVDARTSGPQNKGRHQYGVEIKFWDKTGEFINKMAADIKTAEAAINALVTQGSQARNFDYRVNQYKEVFKRKFSNKNKLAVLVDTLHNYVVASEMVLNGGSPPDVVNKKLLELTRAVDPASGTIKTLEAVAGTMRSVAIQFETLTTRKIAGTKQPITGQNDPEPLSTDSRQTPAKEFVLVKWFNPVFIAGEALDVGYDYVYPRRGKKRGFGLGRDKTSGPIQLTSNQFLQRITEETTKYWKSTEDVVSLIGASLQKAEMSYLTAKDVYTPERTYSLTDFLSTKKLTGLLAAITSFTKDKDPPRAAAKPTKEEERIVLAFNDKLVFTPKALKEDKGVDALETAAQDAVKDRFLSAEIKEEKAIAPRMKIPAIAKLLVNIATEDNGLEISKPKPEDFDLKNPAGRINRIEFRDQASKQRYIGNLPNSIKSLMVSTLTNELTILTPDKALEDTTRKLYYENAMKVDTLAGFRRDVKTGRILIKSPIWKSLTNAEFSNRTYLFCRLQPWQDEVLGLKLGKNMELPVYNEYFTIYNILEEKQKAEVPKDRQAVQAKDSAVKKLVAQKDAKEAIKASKAKIQKAGKRLPAMKAKKTTPKMAKIQAGLAADLKDKNPDINVVKEMADAKKVGELKNKIVEQAKAAAAMSKEAKKKTKAKRGKRPTGRKIAKATRRT